jgi:hypothetical protein
MKKLKNLIIYSLPIIFFSFIGCESDYLDRPAEADIFEEEVFGNYQNFQGFQDVMYSYIIDYNSAKITVGHNLTGETIAVQGWNSAQGASTGNYLQTLIQGRSNFNDYGGAQGTYGIYQESWKGIRVSNLCLENINLLKDASAFEKQVLEGQAYFFRAYFHWEIVRAFGSIPYIDYTLSPENTELSRFWEYKGKFDYQAVTERIVEDMDKAAELLPEVWPNPSSQYGRATKGAALSVKAKALLYAGSPLMNQYSRKSPNFDMDYMRRAAEAAAEVLKLADKGVYELQPFADMKQMFARTDGSLPNSPETIFQKNKRAVGAGEVTTFLGRLYLPHQAIFGGNAITEAVTQNFVDLYEMADGTKYIPGTSASGGYDDDNNKRWNGRDPRFRSNIYVDGDMAGFHPLTQLQLYVGGRTLNGGNTLSPYIVHKFWPLGVNQRDLGWNNFRYVTPHLRLAEIYLIYAEALFEATGNANATSSNYNMTAVEAVNKVRQRAGMPNVTANPVAYNGSFRELVRNERDVELAFEGHRWYDFRRWRKLPDPILYKMTFDRNYTFFNREVIQPFIFEERNFWMPFPRNLTLLYEDFPQNPGW